MKTPRCRLAKRGQCRISDEPSGGDGGGEAPLGHAVGALALLVGRLGLGGVDVPGEAEDGGDDQD